MTQSIDERIDKLRELVRAGYAMGVKPLRGFTLLSHPLFGGAWCGCALGAAYVAVRNLPRDEWKSVVSRDAAPAVHLNTEEMEAFTGGFDYQGAADTDTRMTYAESVRPFYILGREMAEEFKPI